VGHKTRQAREPRRVFWLSSGKPERIARNKRRIPLSEQLEDVQDHVRISRMRKHGSSLEQTWGKQKRLQGKLQHQIIGLARLFAQVAGKAFGEWLAVKKAYSED